MSFFIILKLKVKPTPYSRTFTRDNKFKVVTDDGTEFKVVTDDGTEFKEPAAGLIIYDFDQEPVHVELNGIDNGIWGKYFK